jgi:hypothetical protein
MIFMAVSTMSQNHDARVAWSTACWPHEFAPRALEPISGI